MTTAEDEIFEIIDPLTGKIIGTAPRKKCHGNPAFLHRSVQVLLFSPEGRLLLQKRSGNKVIQPGKWDASAGGHLAPGETWEEAAVRETGEELGVKLSGKDLTFLFDCKVRNAIESENVRVFSTVSAGPFHPLESEISAIDFFDPEDLKRLLADPAGAEIFTPLLRCDLNTLFRENTP